MELETKSVFELFRQLYSDEWFDTHELVHLKYFSQEKICYSRCFVCGNNQDGSYMQLVFWEDTKHSTTCVKMIHIRCLSGHFHEECAHMDLRLFCDIIVPIPEQEEIEPTVINMAVDNLVREYNTEDLVKIQEDDDYGKYAEIKTWHARDAKIQMFARQIHKVLKNLSLSAWACWRIKPAWLHHPEGTQCCCICNQTIKDYERGRFVSVFNYQRASDADIHGDNDGDFYTSDNLYPHSIVFHIDCFERFTDK